MDVKKQRGYYVGEGNGGVGYVGGQGRGWLGRVRLSLILT